MNFNTFRDLLLPHLPLAAVDHCLRLWEENPFHFHLSKRRISKSGDFTCRHGHTPRISVNRDLHPLEFLITYVHEVTHLRVHQVHAFRAEAHGQEWKQTFQELLRPLMVPAIFPADLLKELERHMTNPMASTYSDSALTLTLRKQDPRAAKVTLLSDLTEGSVFDLNGRWFKKGKLQRTRVLCLEVKSKRNFLVPADAPVGHAQLSLLY